MHPLHRARSAVCSGLSHTRHFRGPLSGPMSRMSRPGAVPFSDAPRRRNRTSAGEMPPLCRRTLLRFAPRRHEVADAIVSPVGGVDVLGWALRISGEPPSQRISIRDPAAIVGTGIRVQHATHREAGRIVASGRSPIATGVWRSAVAFAGWSSPSLVMRNSIMPASSPHCRARLENPSRATTTAVRLFAAAVPCTSELGQDRPDARASR